MSNVFKEPKLFGRDDDGNYLARVEQIGTGKKGDTLMLSNRKTNAWVFSLLTGYRQVGVHEVLKPHPFFEGQNVIVTKKDNKIVDVNWMVKQNES